MHGNLQNDGDTERVIARMDAEARIDSASHRLRFQQETAISAIKALTLANGGAILSLLTFVGNHAAKVQAANFEGAFISFAAGLSVALFAYLPAYYSQAWFMHSETSDAWNSQHDMMEEPRSYSEVGEAERKRGWIYQNFGVGCILLGSGLVDQSQKMTVAARAMAERKTVGHRS